MRKEITNIYINSSYATDNSPTNDYTGDGSKIYSITFNTPPIIIKNKANLKVGNICHTGTGHGDNIFIFKIDGIQMDYGKYIGNDGGLPTILSTTFNNTRNLYEENDIPLIKQTINHLILKISTLNASSVNGFNGYFTITSGGSSYSVGNYVIFTGTGGDLITTVASVNSGAITSLNIITDKSNWTNYSSALTILSNGSGAILTATIATGVITAINITNAGVGYKSGQVLTFTGGGGSGANINIASVNATTGAILTFTITSGGTGYTSAPSVSVSAFTPAHTANITPLMNYGVITDGMVNTMNFCMSLKIEEEVNE